MAVTSWRYPGTTASVSPGDVAWTNPGNITLDDGSITDSAVGSGTTTEILKATNFGFVSGDFPAGFTLTGIEIEVDRYQAYFGTVEARDHTVQLYDASGTLTGSNVADTSTNWPTSATAKAYGGAGNMLGTSLTTSDFQDADFGVAFRAQGTAGSSGSAVAVDYIRVRAHLDPPPSGYSIVGIGTVAETTATGGNLTLAEPAGVQEGDLLVAVISYRSNASFANTGSIWTKQEEENSGNTTANSTGSIGSGVAFWGIRGSSAPDLTFERTGGNVARGCIIAYRPDDAGDTFEIDTSTSLTLAAASTSFTMSGFTPAQDATLLVWCGFGARNTTLSAFDAATDPTTASGTTTDTTTDPYFDTWLRRVTSGTATGADCTIAIADAVQETATATGNFTYTAGSSARHAGAVLAFRLVPISSGTEYPQTVNIVAAGSVGVVRSTGKVAALAASGAVSMARVASKTAAVASAVAVTAGKAVSRTLAAAASGAVAVGKSVGLVRAVSATTAVTAEAIRVFLVAISIAASTSASLSRAVAKTLTPAATATVTAARAVSATLGVTVAAAVTASAIRVFLVSVSIAASSAVTLTRSSGKNLALAGASAVALGRAVARTVAIGASSALSVATAATLGVVVTIAASTAVSVTRAAGKALAAAVASSASLARSTSLSLALAASGAVSVAKGIAKGIAVAASGLLSLLAEFIGLPVAPSRINQAFSGAVPGADAFSAAVPSADAFAAAVPARDAFTAPVPANDSFRAAVPAMDEFRAVAA